VENALPIWMQKLQFVLPLVRSGSLAMPPPQSAGVQKEFYGLLEKAEAAEQYIFNTSCFAQPLQSAGKQKEFDGLLEKAEAAPAGELEAVCQQLQQLVGELSPVDAVLSQAGTFQIVCTRLLHPGKRCSLVDDQ